MVVLLNVFSPALRRGASPNILAQVYQIISSQPLSYSNPKRGLTVCENDLGKDCCIIILLTQAPSRVGYLRVFYLTSRVIVFLSTK